MSYLRATCPFCGLEAKRFILPNGVLTNYYFCRNCNKIFTIIQSAIAEYARKMYSSKSDMITSSNLLYIEKEIRIKEKL
jgi:transcription elongation factor Elf1